jgi:class 3 adenylate cyclase
MQWLVYLLCPLMMLVCCGGMLRPGKRGDAGQTSSADCCADQALRPTLTVGRVVSREQEIAHLRADLTELTQRMDRLEAEHDGAPPARWAAG